MWEDYQSATALGESIDCFRLLSWMAELISSNVPSDEQKQVNRLAISPDKRILAAAGHNAVR